jgi:hypothetical protein
MSHSATSTPGCRTRMLMKPAATRKATPALTSSRLVGLRSSTKPAAEAPTTPTVRHAVNSDPAWSSSRSTRFCQASNSRDHAVNATSTRLSSRAAACPPGCPPSPDAVTGEQCHEVMEKRKRRGAPHAATGLGQSLCRRPGRVARRAWPLPDGPEIGRRCRAQAASSSPRADRRRRSRAVPVTTRCFVPHDRVPQQRHTDGRPRPEPPARRRLRRSQKTRRQARRAAIRRATDCSLQAKGAVRERGCCSTDDAGAVHAPMAGRWTLVARPEGSSASYARIRGEAGGRTVACPSTPAYATSSSVPVCLPGSRSAASSRPRCRCCERRPPLSTRNRYVWPAWVSPLIVIAVLVRPRVGLSSPARTCRCRSPSSPALPGAHPSAR